MLVADTTQQEVQHRHPHRAAATYAMKTYHIVPVGNNTTMNEDLRDNGASLNWSYGSGEAVVSVRQRFSAN